MVSHQLITGWALLCQFVLPQPQSDHSVHVLQESWCAIPDPRTSLSSSSAHWQHLTASYAFTSTTIATEGFVGKEGYKKAWRKDRWPYNILFLHRCIIYLHKKSKGRLGSKSKKSSPRAQGQDLSVVQLKLTPLTLSFWVKSAMFHQES